MKTQFYLFDFFIKRVHYLKKVFIRILNSAKENRMDNLIILQLMIDTGLLILIWLVQLIIYPSFHYVAEGNFIIWHRKYVRLISIVVVPLIVSQLVVELVHSFFQSPNWFRLVIIGTIWLATFSFSVACHSSLDKAGKSRKTIKRLIKTNWIRTILWSALFIQTIIVVYGRFT